MTESDLSLDLAATFGPILKKSFPDASPRWRYAVAGALAEAVIERRSWFAQPVDETERLRIAALIEGLEIELPGVGVGLADGAAIAKRQILAALSASTAQEGEQ